MFKFWVEVCSDQPTTYNTFPIWSTELLCFTHLISHFTASNESFLNARCSVIVPERSKLRLEWYWMYCSWGPSLARMELGWWYPWYDSGLCQLPWEAFCHPSTETNVYQIPQGEIYDDSAIFMAIIDSVCTWFRNLWLSWLFHDVFRSIQRMFMSPKSLQTDKNWKNRVWSMQIVQKFLIHGDYDQIISKKKWSWFPKSSQTVRIKHESVKNFKNRPWGVYKEANFPVCGIHCPIMKCGIRVYIKWMQSMCTIWIQ